MPTTGTMALALGCMTLAQIIADLELPEGNLWCEHKTMTERFGDVDGVILWTEVVEKFYIEEK